MSLSCSGLVVRWMAAVAILLPSAGFAENWPGFRGPTGQGISTERNLPVKWSLRENLLWRAEIPGIGWSSPIICENRVFVTSVTPDGTACHLVCLDAANGNVVWDKEVFRQAEDGSTTVIAADGKFRQLAKNALEGPCKASPAISGGRIFIRSQNSLFCVREGAGTSSASGRR